MMFKNKKAYSLSGWTEVALLSTLFIIMFIGIIAEFNIKYGQNYDGSFGLSGQANSVAGNLSDYQNTLQQNVKAGQASSTGLGLSLTTTWSIISSGSSIMWQFLTGGYVEQLVSLLKFPVIVGVILRILFVLSIGFILLKLILKIKP